MTWKYLFGLIYILNQIFYKCCLPVKQKSTIVTEAEICVHREVLEKQHNIDYGNNEVIYRNWPEVQENLKQHCQRFMRKIFPTRRDLAFIIPRLRNVILNYQQLRDRNNNKLKSKRVTALECGLPAINRQRKYIQFIRSPHSPKCVLLLNRIGRTSYNCYIVEDVCEYKDYPQIRKYMAELVEDKAKGATTPGRRRMLVLSVEEIMIKHAEFEKKHNEYCLVNPEVCKLWTEAQEFADNHCKRFIERIWHSSQYLSMVTARLHQVMLNYMELKNENNETMDPVVVNAIACRLPQPIQGRRNVYFIRAPSFPSCVFYIFRNKLSIENFYIVEEICDSSNLKISIYQIFMEHEKFLAGKNIGRKRKTRVPTPEEILSKKCLLEQRHYEAYKLDKEIFANWPEAKSVPNNICTHFLQGIVTNKYELSLVSGQFQEVILYYTELQDEENMQDIEPLTLTVMRCRFPRIIRGYRYVYLARSPSYPDCILFLNKLQKMPQKYYISEEVCESADFISYFRILSIATQKALKNRRAGFDTIEKREEYEIIHLQYYRKQKNACEHWPELEQTNKKDICQAFLTQIHPRVTKKCDIEAESKSLQLKYCIKKCDTEKTLQPWNVKALVCTLPLMHSPNHFTFIRTPKPNCVYWTKKFYKHRKYYFISRELCVNELLSKSQIEEDLNLGDVGWMNELLSDNEFVEYLRKCKILL